MKNFTLLLAIFISGFSFAQNSSSDVATVNAEIVSPIKITSSGTLDFGQIAQDDALGDVIVSSDGSGRIFTNSEMEISSSTFTVPTFTVTKDALQTYGIVATGDELQNADGDTMTLTNIRTSLDSNSGNTAGSFTVGGRLKVGAGQAVGEYEGEVKVTVTYE